MPSSGKSTIGKIVADKIGFQFIDLDAEIEKQEGKGLIEVLAEKGGIFLLDGEYEILRTVDPSIPTIISPAGSIIYHHAAMEWIREHCYTIFINAELEKIRERLALTPKAILGLKEKGLERLFEERHPEYAKAADVTIEAKDKLLKDIVSEAITHIKNE